MDVSPASELLKLLKEGGVLGALVAALCVIVYQYRENKALAKEAKAELMAEKDAHRATAERLTDVAQGYADIVERLGERRPRATRKTKTGRYAVVRPEGGGGPEEG